MTKFVIIDDDKNVAQLVKEVIIQGFQNVQVEIAFNGFVGYEKIKKMLPDLVIVDISLPGINGDVLCKKLKEIKSLSRIPILMITGSADQKYWKTKSLDIGAAAFISKPFEVSELISQIRAVLNVKFVEDRLIRQCEVLKSDLGQKTELIRRQNNDYKELFNGFVKVMATTIDSLSIYSFSSMKQVAEILEDFIGVINSNKVGRYKNLRFDDEHKEKILTAAWLHDIGKILLPANIMNKTTRLGDSYQLLTHRLETIYYWAKQNNPDLLGHHQEACEIISKYNDPLTKQTEHDISKILKIAELCYDTHDGDQKNWLTAYEVECLLIKQGTLTISEREEVMSHVKKTDMLLSNICFPEDKEMIREWAGSHHELLDGSGYWRGLKGDEIPVETRILTIVDIYEALVSSDRPYRKKMSKKEALQAIKTMGEEGKLDKDLVGIYINSGVWKQV